MRVWIGVPEDSYIAQRDLDTVDIELTLIGGNHLAAVNTVLEADQVSEARTLAREIVAGLESGEPRADRGGAGAVGGSAALGTHV